MTVTPNPKLVKPAPQLNLTAQEPSMEPAPSLASHSHPVELLDLRPRIIVMGCGGAGGNAVNNMIRSHLEGVEFIVCNTDAQALSQALTKSRVQLGAQITQGLGAGSQPEMGRAAAEESMEEILRLIDGANMLFITAGMGGGTGTGAAPVIAQMAREHGILTVGVVTKPFHFEGAHRMRTAERGIEELQQFVDTLIVIPNQNLFRISTEKTTFADAFKMADDVLYSGVRSITDLMIMPGLINLDFADIRTVMSEMGKAMMGTGEAQGDRRALNAAEAAISNPLLDEVSMRGAKGVLISITGGMDLTLFEVDEAANRIRDEVDVDANIIVGATFDERLNGRIRVSLFGTGMDQISTYGASLRASVSAIETPLEALEPAISTSVSQASQVSQVSEDTPLQAPVAEDPAELPLTPSRETTYDEMAEREVTVPMQPHPRTEHQPGVAYGPDVHRKPGFFERMRNGLIGKPQSSVAAQPPHLGQPPKSMRVRPVETASVLPEKGEEVSDVPAFLRRKG